MEEIRHDGRQKEDTLKEMRKKIRRKRIVRNPVSYVGTTVEKKRGRNRKFQDRRQKKKT